MRVAIISQFRDEAEYLKEWIEFHLMVGIDKFYLINHLSADNYLEVLQPYLDSGVVTLENLTVETNTGSAGRINEEVLVNHSMAIINDIYRKMDADWGIFLNTDEFLYPEKGNTIKEPLSRYPENFGQIAVNWRLMGNSNYALKEGELLTEKLTKADPRDTGEGWNLQRHTKCLIRKAALHHFPSVHYGIMNPNYLHVDSVGNLDNIETDKYRTKVQVLENLIINHYTFRDLTYTERKMDMYKSWGRGFPDEDWYKNQYNIEDNFDIQRFLPQLKERMGI